MFTRVLGVSVLGVCLGSLGCSSDGTQGPGAAGATAAAGGGGAAAGASSSGQAGSPLGGNGGTSPSNAGSGSSAGGSSGGAGVSAAAGSSGASGASSNAAAGGSVGTAGANPGGAAGNAGTAGTGGGLAAGGAGGAGDPPSCVPDGSGSITMTLSGSVPFDETRGNDYTCLGSFSSAAAGAALILRVDDPTPKPYGVVFANLPKFEPGDVGNIAFDSLSFVLAPGGLWDDPSSATPDTKHCTFNVTANQALAGMPNNYRVTGSIACNSALPGLPDAITVQKLQFVTLFSPAE